jgi:plastocyanin
MVRTKLLSGLGVGILALVIAGCGSSSTSTSSSNSGSTSCTAGNGTVCVEPDPTNVGKYNPDSITVKSGDKVTWIFTDTSSQHTVTFDDGSFDSQPQSSGYTTTQTISKPAGTTIGYHCTLHANMMGKIVVQ